mgnify:CR=1 FL=1
MWKNRNTMHIERYSSRYEALWNDFVAHSKNGTFLFDRHYMDYHADRFIDCSLLFFEKSKPVALLPANISEGVVFSHEGLTYGGIIAGRTLTARMAVDVLQGAATYCRDRLRAHRMYYNPVPYIYQTYPAQEDLYALFRMKARHVGCGLSTTVSLRQPLRFTTLRRRCVRKAVRESVTVEESSTWADWEAFWEVLTVVLKRRHATLPVHTLAEILLLRGRFPDNIRLIVARRGGNVVAGCVLYICTNAVHVQYIAAGEEGRAVGALDLLFCKVMESEICRDKEYFDFGISTEDNGRWLNDGLIFQKEGYGGRGVCYDHYLIEF